MSDDPSADDAAILDRFESLGDSCEFGFAQRAAGAEPVALLRWSSVSLDGLVAMLGARFDGLYAFEHCVVLPGGMVQDRLARIGFHMGSYMAPVAQPTPLPDTPAARAQHAAELRQIRFRAARTLDRLDRGLRIFVYKTNAGLAPGQMRRLKAALDGYGPQRLFCVLPASDALPAGTVRLLAPGLMTGAMGRLAPYEAQDACDAPGWVALCRAALAADWAEDDAAGRDAEPPPVPPLRIGDAAQARALVTALYRALLGREPDEGGLAFHAASLLSGHTVEGLIGDFVASAEYCARAGLVSPGGAAGRP